jgi:hypothetical protein
MKSRFLVQKFHQEGKHVFNCTMLSRNIVGDSEQECLRLLHEELENFLRTKGRQWVDQFKGDRHGNEDALVNCPDGYVLLPIDTWCCKHDKEVCGLAVDISNEERFLAHCRSEKKAGILRAVQSKKYDGFHHVLGRYLCPLCDKNLAEREQNFKYHYPWELYPLWDCVNFETEEAFWVFKNSGWPSSISFSKLCANCFMLAIDKFLPGDPLAKSLFVVELNFYPR